MIKTEHRPRTTGSYKVRAFGEAGSSAYSNTITLHTLSRKCCRIQDVFPEPESWGIFSLLLEADSNIADLFKRNNLDPTLLDMEYVFNHSGAKKISCLLEALIRRNDVNKSWEYPITVETYLKIASIISMRYSQKWSELWQTLSYEYDPLSPYELTVEERGTDDMNTTRTVKTTDESQETSQRTDESNMQDNSTENTDGSATKNSKTENSGTSSSNDRSIDTLHVSGKEGSSDESKHFTFGFNGSNSPNGDMSSRDTKTSNSTSDRTQTDVLQSTSEEKTNDSSSTEDISSENKKSERSNTVKKNVSESSSNTANGSHNTDETYNRTNPTSRNITRTGNIGNLTRQELIAKQRELLQWQFLDVVFDDIDKVLSCGAY